MTEKELNQRLDDFIKDIKEFTAELGSPLETENILVLAATQDAASLLDFLAKETDAINGNEMILVHYDFSEEYPDLFSAGFIQLDNSNIFIIGEADSDNLDKGLLNLFETFLDTLEYYHEIPKVLPYNMVLFLKGVKKPADPYYYVDFDPDSDEVVFTTQQEADSLPAIQLFSVAEIGEGVEFLNGLRLALERLKDYLQSDTE